MKVIHSRSVDEELKRAVSLTKSSDNIPLGVVIEITANSSFRTPDPSSHERPSTILLERWIIKFTAEYVF